MKYVAVRPVDVYLRHQFKILIFVCSSTFSTTFRRILGVAFWHTSQPNNSQIFIKQLPCKSFEVLDRLTELRDDYKVQYLILTASGWNGYCSPNSKYWTELLLPPPSCQTWHSCRLPDWGHIAGVIAIDIRWQALWFDELIY